MPGRLQQATHRHTGHDRLRHNRPCSQARSRHTQHASSFLAQMQTLTQPCNPLAHQPHVLPQPPPDCNARGTHTVWPLTNSSGRSRSMLSRVHAIKCPAVSSCSQQHTQHARTHTHTCRHHHTHIVHEHATQQPMRRMRSTASTRQGPQCSSAATHHRPAEHSWPPPWTPHVCWCEALWSNPPSRYLLAWCRRTTVAPMPAAHHRNPRHTGRPLRPLTPMVSPCYTMLRPRALALRPHATPQTVPFKIVSPGPGVPASPPAPARPRRVASGSQTTAPVPRCEASSSSGEQ